VNSHATSGIERRDGQACRLRHLRSPMGGTTVGKGELVFKRDERGDRMFILAQGVVKLYES
jgi:CRP-like cAMP-binding protein